MPDTKTYAFWTEYAVHSNLAVRGFFGPYRWLSNFHLSPVCFEGQTFPSVENAFQAAKTLNRDLRAEFITLTPSESKRRGKEVTLRGDWESVKLGIMRDLITHKFDTDRQLFTALITAPDHLEETNHWGDKFWGVDAASGEGQNNLGKILMEYRKCRNPV